MSSSLGSCSILLVAYRSSQLRHSCCTGAASLPRFTARHWWKRVNKELSLCQIPGLASHWHLAAVAMVLRTCCLPAAHPWHEAEGSYLATLGVLSLQACGRHHQACGACHRVSMWYAGAIFIVFNIIILMLATMNDGLFRPCP